MIGITGFISQIIEANLITSITNSVINKVILKGTPNNPSIFKVEYDNNKKIANISEVLIWKVCWSGKNEKKER